MANLKMSVYFMADKCVGVAVIISKSKFSMPSSTDIETVLVKFCQEVTELGFLCDTVFLPNHNVFAYPQ